MTTTLPQPAPPPGARVGRYLVLEPLGVSRGHWVVAAFDPQLDRAVALTLLSAEAAFTEAKALARLSHPNVVQLLDAAQTPEHPWLAHELVRGQSLEAWLAHARPTAAQVLDAFLAAGRGLQAMHRAGVAHAGFSATEVLRGVDGRVQVAGFGGARPASPEACAVDQRDFCAAVKAALHVTPGGVPRGLVQALERGLSERPWPSLEVLLDVLDVQRAHRKQARRAALAALGVLAVALALALRGPPARCDGGPPKLAAVWGPQPKASLREAFARIEAPEAMDTAARVSEVLDAFGASWLEARREVCEATRLRGEQSEAMLDRRTGCLDQRLLVVQALLQLFATADRALLDEAVGAAHSAAELRGCLDAPPATDAPATSAEARERLEASRRALAEVQALSIASRWNDAEQTALAALQTAATPRLDATLRHRLGHVQRRKGALAAAEASLDRALLDAEALGDADTITRTWLELAEVALDHGEADRARSSAAHAEAMAARAGTNSTLEFHLEGTLAHLDTVLRNHAGAVAHGERQLALARASRGPGSLQEAYVLGNMATPLGRLERHDEARAAVERSLQLKAQLLGPTSPSVAASLQALGQLELRVGRPAQALVAFQRSLELRESASGGAVRRRLAISHGAMGTALAGLDRLDEAQAALERALVLTEGLEGARQTWTQLQFDLTSLALRRDQLPLARHHVDAACAVAFELDGPAGPASASCLMTRGAVELAEGQASAALESTLASLLATSGRTGPDHHLLTAPWAQVSDALRALGAPEAALASADESKRLASLLPQHRPGEGVARFALAKALRPFDLAHARVEAEAARAAYASVPAPLRTAEVEAWLSALPVEGGAK